MTLGVRELAQQLGVGRDAAAKAMGHTARSGLISVAAESSRRRPLRWNAPHHSH